MSQINYHYMHWLNQTEPSDVELLMDQQWALLQKADDELQLVAFDPSQTNLEIEIYQKEMEERVFTLSQEYRAVLSALADSAEQYNLLEEKHALEVRLLKGRIREASIKLYDKNKLIHEGIEQSKNEITKEIARRAIAVQQASQAAASSLNSAIQRETQNGNNRVAQENANGAAALNAEQQKLQQRKAAVNHFKNHLSQSIGKAAECKNSLETGRGQISTMYQTNCPYTPMNRLILGKEAEEAALQRAIELRNSLNEAFKYI